MEMQWRRDAFKMRKINSLWYSFNSASDWFLGKKKINSETYHLKHIALKIRFAGRKHEVDRNWCNFIAKELRKL